MRLRLSRWTRIRCRTWYADAKLGIFIHWGLYSVPGWAVLTPEKELEKLRRKEYLKRNPYAEWYYNTMRLDGSPTQEYHKEHYGADYNYYNFAETFDKEIQKWNPEEMASAFKMAGARYVVLTSKHHEGFTLWPSETPNPTLPKDRQHATRDLVGELTAAVREKGMRMGVITRADMTGRLCRGRSRIGSRRRRCSRRARRTGSTRTRICGN